jgi:hypothetical protein
LIYRRAGNLRAVQLLLGHTRIESTVRYLGVEGGHVANTQGDQVATAQLAVDCKIEHCQVARAALEL